MLLLLFFIGLIVWISDKFGPGAGGIAFLVILVLTIIMVARDNRKDIDAYYNWRDYWLTGKRVRNRKEEEARIVEAERAVRRAESEVKRLEREVKKEPPQAAEMPPFCRKDPRSPFPSLRKSCGYMKGRIRTSVST